MCCKSFWKRIVPFTLAVMLGVFISGLFQEAIRPIANKAVSILNTEKNYSGQGTGIGDGKGVGTEVIIRSGTNPLQIISKPMAHYTDAARQNQVQGTITLRVAFLASGQIGSISPITNLPDGLTEQAISAARNIEFQPATTDGKAIAVTKTVQYSFMIY